MNHQACFKQFCAFMAPNTTTAYGARPLAAVTEDDIEAFFAHLRAKGFAQSTLNKCVQMVKALFRWPTKKSYLPRNPAADSDVLKRGKHAQRHRRLEPGEEEKLLAHAGTRRGDLLNLTWRDVNLDRREMTSAARRARREPGG